MVTTEKLTKLLAMFRETLADVSDPLKLNLIRFQAGEAAITLSREVGEMEANRKAFQFELRDRLIAASEEGEGKALSRTAAEAEARTHPEYVAYLDALAEKQTLKEQAELLRDVAAQRAYIMTAIMEAESRKGAPAEA